MSLGSWVSFLWYSTTMERLYTGLAAAYVRGSLPDLPEHLGDDELVRHGESAGLRLQRFKITSGMPRIRAVLGALRGIRPESVLDVGSGRGVFLWPLLHEFPFLPVTAVEPEDRRRGHLEAVCRGGMGRLTVLGCDASCLPLLDASYDVVTVLEVLEHQVDPLPLACEVMRVARKFVIVSVPAHADDNPEHVQLFTAASLGTLLSKAGAGTIRIDHVGGHILAVARVAARERDSSVRGAGQ